MKDVGYYKSASQKGYRLQTDHLSKGSFNFLESCIHSLPSLPWWNFQVFSYWRQKENKCRIYAPDTSTSTDIPVKVSVTHSSNFFTSNRGPKQRDFAGWTWLAPLTECLSAISDHQGSPMLTSFRLKKDCLGGACKFALFFWRRQDIFKKLHHFPKLKYKGMKTKQQWSYFPS